MKDRVCSVLVRAWLSCGEHSIKTRGGIVARASRPPQDGQAIAVARPSRPRYGYNKGKPVQSAVEGMPSLRHKGETPSPRPAITGS